jgi:PASTA domain
VAFHFENPFKKLSKTEIYVVIGGVTLITAYAEYRHHKTTGSWSPFASGSANAAGTGSEANGASPTGTVTDPATGQTFSDTQVDPITNLTYASEISQYGGVAAAESQYSSMYGASTGAVSGRNYDTGYPSAQAQIGVSTVNGNSVYTSNSAWAQAVTAGLEDISGGPTYDGTDIASALGSYLTGTPLSPGQATVVKTGIAEFGPAPVGNLQIIAQPVAGPAPVPGKPVVKDIPVPDVVGESASAAAAHLHARGLKNSSGVAGNDVIASTVPKAGTLVKPGTVVKIIPGKKKIPATESK